MFEWNSKYEIDEPTIDNGHHELFKLLNSIGDRLSGAEIDEECLEDSVQNLIAYAKQNFERERQIMESAGVDLRHIKQQKMEHSSFFYDIERLHNISVDEGLDIRYEKLLKFVTSWLVFHTLRTDKKLGIQLKELKAGRTPDEAFTIAEHMEFGATVYRPMVDALVHLWSDAMETIREMEAKSDDG